MTREDPMSLSAARLLSLRRFPGLEGIDVDDLAKLLAATTERVVRRDTRLARHGAPLTAAYFVIEGRLKASGGGAWHEVGPHETLGIVKMIAESDDGLDIECVTDAVVLEFERDDFLAFTAENFDILEGLLRSFGAGLLALSPFEGTAESVNGGRSPYRAGAADAHGTPSEVIPEASGPAGSFVERVLFLTGLATFGLFGAETTADLAVSLEEHRPPEGVLARSGEPLDAIYVVTSGALRFGSALVRRGGVFGLLYAVSDSPLPFDLTAAPDTCVLTCRADIVVDLLEDNVASTLAWLRRLAERVVDLAPAAAAHTLIVR